MNGYQLGALLDSGAAISAISSTMLSKVFPNYHQHVCQVEEIFKTASGEKMAPIGKIVLFFTIDGHKCSTEFYIFNDMNQQVILGRTFLVQCDGKINFQSSTLEFSPTINLVSAERHKIEPGEVCLIQATCDTDTKDILPRGLHGQIHHERKLNGLEVCPIASTLGNEVVPIVLVNTSNHPVVVKKESQIAHFTPLKECECIEISSDTHQSTPSENSISSLQSDECDLDDMGFDFSKSTCESDQLGRLKKVLHRHKTAFLDSSGTLGHCDWVKHKITLKPGAIPQVKMPYRLAPAVKEAIQMQIDSLLKQGILKEVESEWASPLLVVRKGIKRSRKHMQQPLAYTTSAKDVRMVLDYRWLNANTIYNKVEIPRMSSLIDTIGQAKPTWFTSLDMKDGYFQQELTEESIPLTAFLFNNKTLAFTRVPQGLSGSPMSFQRLMNKVLQPYLGKDLVIYLDDVLIFSRDFNTHIKAIDNCLAAFKRANLRLNPRKCTWATNSCEFLGHLITQEGISLSPSHTKAIQTYPVPKNVKEVRTFVGLCAFFKDFIPQRAQLTSPLTALTRKGSVFQWTEECDRSFEKLKSILTSEPVLVYPDFSKQFFVITDAAASGIGAVLVQKDERTLSFRAVSYCGRATTQAERKLPATAA